MSFTCPHFQIQYVFCRDLSGCTTPATVAAVFARDIALLNSAGDAGRASDGRVLAQSKLRSLKRMHLAVFGGTALGSGTYTSAGESLPDTAVAPAATHTEETIACAWSALHKALSKRVCAPPGTEVEAVRIAALRLLRRFLSPPPAAAAAGVTSGAKGCGGDLDASVSNRCNVSCCDTDNYNCGGGCNGSACAVDITPALPYLVPALCCLASTSPCWVLYAEAGVFAADGACAPANLNSNSNPDREACPPPAGIDRLATEPKVETTTTAAAAAAAAVASCESAEAGVEQPDDSGSPSNSSNTTVSSTNNTRTTTTGSSNGVGSTSSSSSIGSVTASSHIIDEHRRGKLTGGLAPNPASAGVLLRPGYGEPHPLHASEELRLEGARALCALISAAVTLSSPSSNSTSTSSSRASPPHAAHPSSTLNAPTTSTSISGGVLAPYWAELLMAAHALSRDSDPEVRVLVCEVLIPSLMAAAPDVCKYVATPLARSLCAGGVNARHARVRVASLRAFSACCLCVDDETRRSAGGDALLSFLGSAGAGERVLSVCLS